MSYVGAILGVLGIVVMVNGMSLPASHPLIARTALAVAGGALILGALLILAKGERTRRR